MAEEGQPRGAPEPPDHTRGNPRSCYSRAAALVLTRSCFKFIFSIYPLDSYLHVDTILTQNRLRICLQQMHPETRTKREEQGAKEAFSPTNYRALGPTKP